MPLLADADGNLTERHDILCVNGVHYLIEPLHKVSYHARLPFNRITSEYNRRDLLWTIPAQLSSRLEVLTQRTSLQIPLRAYCSCGVRETCEKILHRKVIKASFGVHQENSSSKYNLMKCISQGNISENISIISLKFIHVATRLRKIKLIFYSLLPSAA